MGALCVVVLAGLGAIGCGQPSLPAPTSVGGIPLTEQFTGTLAPSGSAFYSFSVPVAGTVSLTLISMTGAGVPGDALFPVGIGTPAGTGCSAGIGAAVSPGGSPQYTTNKARGVYCAQIFDNARLTAPATFVLNITHPQ